MYTIERETRDRLKDHSDSNLTCFRLQLSSFLNYWNHKAGYLSFTKILCSFLQEIFALFVCVCGFF